MSGIAAKRIIELLEFAFRDRRLRFRRGARHRIWDMQHRVERNSESSELIAALQQATNPKVRGLLCYTLGHRKEVEAVPTLIELMDDPDPDLHFEAADALLDIGDPRAGEVMLRYYTTCAEDNVGMKRLYLLALGTCDYRPAIPLFINALNDADEFLRTQAAWSLSIWNVTEAKDAIQNALQRAESEHDRDRIRKALARLEDTQVS